MIWHLAGKASSLYLEFLHEGEFVVPDPGSIFLTVRDNAGAPLVGYDALAVADVPGTTTTLVLPLEVNTIGAVDFETRYVQVEFTSAGKPLVLRQTYRVGPFLPLACYPSEVRGLFGAREQELPDSDIDLRGAYYLLLKSHPTSMASTALVDPVTSWLANRVVVLQAGLLVAPSMPSRALKEEALNNATHIRASIDWAGLQHQLEAELGAALGQLDEAASVGVVVPLSPILFLSNPTDPVTNA